MNVRILMIFKNDRLLVFFLILLGFAIRLPYLGSPLYGDEAISFNRYGLLFWKEILFYYPDTNQHALFSILSNFSMQLFGENEVAFRFPSFIAGIFSIPLLYFTSRSLAFSFQTSFLASCLLAVSAPHLHYSQQGRGYSLTVFFALAIILSIAKIFQGRTRPGWGGLLILSGFCMALTLPSNATFLVSAAAFCIATKWLERNPDRFFFDKTLVFLSVLFLILALLVGGYFYIIFPGLKVGMKGNNYTPIDITFLSEIALFLFEPWGYWLLALIGLGSMGLKAKKEIALFPAIFGVPIIATLASGVGGFPRIFIYLLPFILLLAAKGISKIIVFLSTFKRVPAYILLAGFALGMVCQPADNRLEYDSEQKTRKSASTMAEARQIFSHAQKHVPDDQLLIFLLNPEETVLNHYFQGWLKQSMFDFALGKTLNKTLFISHEDVPLENIQMFSYFPGHILKLPENSIKQITSIRNIRLHEFDKKISRIVPAVYDPDYETRLDIPNSPILKVDIEERQNMLGANALVLKKQVEMDFTVTSRKIKSFHIKEEGAYLLTIYLRKYGQNSRAFLADYDPAHWPPDIGYINPYFGEITFPGTTFNWQMVFLLSQISVGQHNLVEVFYLQDKISYFDGFQSYILY